MTSLAFGLGVLPLAMSVVWGSGAKTALGTAVRWDDDRRSLAYSLSLYFYRRDDIRH